MTADPARSPAGPGDTAGRSRSPSPDPPAARPAPPSPAQNPASTLGWDRYVGIDGAVIGMRTFGASAPLKALAAEFGFTTDAVVRAARDQIAAAADRQAGGA